MFVKLGNRRIKNVMTFYDKDQYLNCHIRKPVLCLGEKGAGQLCSNCTADQRLCFHHTDSTIPLLKCET